MLQVDELLHRLDRVLKSRRPEFYERLYPGATDVEVAALEGALGFSIPDDFKAFLRWKNGYDFRHELPEFRHAFLPYRFFFLDHSQIIATYNCDIELHEKYGENHRDKLWSPIWIPFVWTDNTDIYYIDMKGSFTGKIGQVLTDYACGEQVQIDHESFLKWLETVVIAYEDDLISFEEDEIRDSYYSYNDLIKQLNPGYPIIINPPE